MLVKVATTAVTVTKHKQIQRRPLGDFYKATFGWLFFNLAGLVTTKERPNWSVRGFPVRGEFLAAFSGRVIHPDASYKRQAQARAVEIDTEIEPQQIQFKPFFEPDVQAQQTQQRCLHPLAG